MCEPRRDTGRDPERLGGEGAGRETDAEGARDPERRREREAEGERHSLPGTGRVREDEGGGRETRRERTSWTRPGVPCGSWDRSPPLASREGRFLRGPLFFSDAPSRPYQNGGWTVCVWRISLSLAGGPAF